MANCDSLFREFNGNLQVPKTKRTAMTTSKMNLRKMIKDHFSSNHPAYSPTFWTQGSSKTKNMIRTKDDTCDLDDGIYFKDNPDKVTGTTLQRWVKEAVDGITAATPSHRKKCITVDFRAGYNIDLPIFLFDEATDKHPRLAVKDEDFKTDDPKEFITEFNRVKDAGGQLIRITRYLKSWCDYRRHEMPRGLAMTVLAMNHTYENDRDDVALKYILISIESELKREFKCIMPTTPNDDLFENYDPEKKRNFMNHLASFIEDAKQAVDSEKNELKASRLWQKNFGRIYFPNGEDKDEEETRAGSLNNVIGNAKPYRSGQL